MPNSLFRGNSGEWHRTINLGDFSGKVELFLWHSLARVSTPPLPKHMCSTSGGVVAQAPLRRESV